MLINTTAISPNEMFFFFCLFENRMVKKTSIEKRNHVRSFGEVAVDLLVSGALRAVSA